MGRGRGTHCEVRRQTRLAGFLSLFLTWAEVPASSGAWVGGFALEKQGQQMAASWGTRPGRSGHNRVVPA